MTATGSPVGRDAFIPEFLSFLERREARLLNWGFLDVAFDAPDIETLLEDEGPDDLADAWRALRGSGADMSGLLRDMGRDGLLHFLPDERGRFRTRFAEGVRLTARLRQMFRAADWATGPRLVSDVKLRLGPRRYPRRDQTVAACWADLAGGAATSPDLQRATFEALAQDAGGRSYPGFAGFQRRAFSKVLSRYGRDEVTGSVVSAGTGSGKTKAAYLPAFLGVVADIERDPAPFTKVMAVYPRNVLLGDQLREALAEAAKVAPVLAARGLRPITFGALTGDVPPAGALARVPREGEAVSPFLRNWARRRDAWRLPLVKSPRDGGNDLLWLDADREAGRTTLRSVDDPNGEPHVADGVMRLTRDAIQASPPDVLLLSIEMLHREMGNPSYAAAFGIRAGRGRAPRILLLDEIHTYEGLSGAQIPWVLRRWRSAARPAGLQVLGLSATLRDAKAHLAAVSGVPAFRVDEFRPLEHPDPERDEFRSEGQEYTLLVKGNAASGSPLLATSIQCAMLMSRLLTPRHVAPGAGSALYARKVFGFTDNLDGINRWYADLRDAEQVKGLARLRAPDGTAGNAAAARAERRRKREEGQVWDLPAELGHDLHVRYRVDRCSSQDAGVNAGADIVVATASLEVGYDDPDVGVTLHHKTPRSTASFLQRKGRAGRRRGTRPATVVVLSDYGRDRWSFQNSERLFDPGLERIALPALNPYVLRIQGTAFLIDWLGRRVGSPNPFAYLRRPDRTAKAAQDRARALLGEMLDGGRAFGAFRDDLVELVRPALAAHGLADRADAVVDGILWDEPRPVLRHAVPALLRKLEAGWAHADPARGDLQEDVGRTRPIPDYLPASSFAPLDGIEVAIRFPGRAGKDPEALDAARALTEACPGRISKRYSVRQGEPGYWLAGSALAAAGGEGDVVASVEGLFADFVRVGTADVGTPVYQPLALDLTDRPADVSDSSNARWEWRTRMEALGPGTPLPVFVDRAFAPSLGPVTAHLHGEGGGVRVMRHASAARFEMRFTDGRVRRGRLRLVAGGADADGAGPPEAVGFEQAVDGIRVGLVPASLADVPVLDDATLLRLRPAYFLELLLADELVVHRAGSFMIDWLWQTSMAMLAATATAGRCDLPEARRRLAGRRPEAAGRVLDRIFGGMPAGHDDDGDDASLAPGSPPGRARQRDRLLDLWRDPQVVARVEEAETALWSDPRGPAFDAWVRSRYQATVAQALRAAVLALAPDISEDDVVVDLVAEPTDGPDAGGPAVAAYLTETGPGGLGQVESVVARMRAEPEAFEDAFRRALDHCPREATSAMMLHVAGAARRAGPRRNDPDGVARALRRVRDARGHHDAAEARRVMGIALDAAGVEPTRDALAAVVGRLARPGSGPVTDALARGLDRAWRRCERRLGMGVDPRVFAYLCAERAGLRRRIVAFLRDLGGVAPVDHQVHAVVRDTLLPGCVDGCPECLDHHHRFDGLAPPSRDLARRWLRLRVTRIDAGLGLGWLERAREVLRDEGRVAVVADASLGPHVGRGLQILLAGSVERDFVMAPVSLAGVSRTPDGWTVLLRLRAAAHV
ncbi:protein DpdJ [Methylobacterium fujisawaense]